MAAPPAARPAPQPARLDPQECLDGVLSAQETPVGAVVDWSRLRVLDPGDLLALLPAEVPFATSGSTGPPAVWLRGRGQLVAETAELARALAGAEPDALVVHAPLHHLYGMLFGALLPTLLGRPAYYTHTTDPLPRSARRLLVVGVPSSWWRFDRAPAELSRYERLTVTHSTGPLPSAAHRVRDRRPELGLFEVHGSTETGMVGRRTHEHDDWTLAPDVSLADPSVPGQQALLAVRSPRLARPAGGDFPSEHVLDDVVETVDARTYRLVGRGGKTVNINGRRADLRAIEATLRTAVPTAAPVCLLVDDPVRGEWYEVRTHGGPPERQAVEEAALRLLPPWQAPRAVLMTARPSAT
ncbi:class I adenylate-forming enzyme family protein [Streptomyces sp. NPDC004542]|uniref:class I adenylate-forming enzyme family protein n=1 Tax=Streptomyces sp. NPDC004542 TaxID=3154281 RepID=UPI00339F0BCC